MTLDMMALRERFVQHPLLPPSIHAQQNKWRQRWGLHPKAAEPGESWAFYFDPSDIKGRTANDPRHRLRFALSHGKPGTKYFLTGSKGAGKSTTAYALWTDPEITRRYTLLGFTLQDYLNLADTDAGQLIAVMIAHVIERLHDAEAGAALADAQDRATVKALNVLLASVRPSARLEQINVNVFGWFTAIFKESSTAREAFKQYINGQFEEVMTFFDDLNTLLEKHTGKPTLFVIDDLDKIAASDVRHRMFQMQLPMLLRPRCAALYSYPIEVDHDPRFDNLKRSQPNRYVLANVKLVDCPGGAMLDEGRAVMTEFVHRRLDGRQCSDVIDLTPTQWDRVFSYSAGNFRELSRILCHAFEIAAMDDKSVADRACFELALQRMRADYNMFVQHHHGLLTQIREQRDAPSDRIDPDLSSTLLAAFVVVEYPNEPGWLGLNPIVADLLDRKKSLLGE